ncbi:hypothetical protein IEQ34_015223 [Dendrobium chrysotoxum]|uniref:Uncharacterized protein n=1 Tax=Dendrobium chrysotoxum TaxID=161865 RepID=A0AAV7GFB1_DENCH|nr:hypothetical protein IEQ34_015223 [Dendrobium chrysotoxum]
MRYRTSPSPLTLSGTKVRVGSHGASSLDRIWGRWRRRKGKMINFFVYQYHSQRGAVYAALLVMLLPVFWPALFSPLGHASPSMFSEWNAPKPRHASLLKGALNSEIVSSVVEKASAFVFFGLPIKRKSELWALWRHRVGNPVFRQQVLLICDAVAVAKILNATLI